MSVPTLTLSDFLLARIAENEADARQVQQAAANAFGGDLNAWIVAGMDDATGVDYDPARVLAECDAKRRIVEEVARDVDSLSSAYVDATDEEADWPAERLLRLLALPYADHPDYREEWKP